jgi:release factor glutamine methyltransferase
VTVLETIQRSAEFLAKKGVESPRLQIELLLAHALGLPRLNLYLNFERILTEAEIETVRTLVKRRGRREPLQHIVGSTSFCGYEIRVTPDVLIPRPETELLAEKAGQFLRDRLRLGGALTSALDFGTGSGCLAIAIAIQFPVTQTYALDISDAALAIARENAARHNVADKIHFLAGDGFEALPKELRFDLIVANPPYIPTHEIATLAPEVRDFDPPIALNGGADGLEFYRHLAGHARSFLNPSGRLMIEFGDGQAEAIREILGERRWLVESVDPDYTNRPRILVARPAQS